MVTSYLADMSGAGSVPEKQMNICTGLLFEISGLTSAVVQVNRSSAGFHQLTGAPHGVVCFGVTRLRCL